MAYLWWYYPMPRQRRMTILEVPAYLNLRLGTGNRVLYSLFWLRTSWEAAEVPLPCAFCCWLFTVVRSSGITKHSLHALAVMLWVQIRLSQHEAVPAFPLSGNIPLCWIFSWSIYYSCTWPGSNPG